MSGGFLATVIVSAVTYGTGAFFEASGWLADWWTNVTPGQAATVLGTLTYLTANWSKIRARVCEALALMRRLAAWLKGR